MMIRIITTILLLLTSNLAYSADLFTPASGDISLKVLGGLFGGLLPNGGSDPMLNAIKTFNGGVLIIGGLLAAYTILLGTMGTAHDGEMMGKKFSSVWIPIRYSVGTALVLPVVGGGYATIQAIVVWLVIQGVGLADQVWTSFQSNPIFSQQTKIPELGDNSSLKLVENTFLAYVCVLGNQKGVDEVGSATEFVLKYKKKYKFGVTQDGDTFNFGNTLDKNDLSGCGSITLPSYSYTVTQQAPSTNGMLGQINLDFTPIDVTPIVNSHRTATTSMMSEVSLLVSELLGKAGTNFDPKTYYSRLEQISKNYDKVVNASSSQFNKTYQHKPSQNGWFEAGYMLKRITDDNNILSSVSSSVSSSTASLARSLDNTWFADSTIYLSVAKPVLLLSKNNQLDNLTITKDDSTKKVETGTSLSGKIASAIGEAATGINLFNLKNDTRHPTIIASDLGHQLINFNVSVMSYMAALGLVAGSIASIFGGGVTSFMVVFSSFMTIPFAFLWVIGFVCAYVIPVLPAFIFTGVIIGWLLLVVEGVLAAPLWVIAHLNPKGDDLTGSAQAGYQLLLSLVLRPALIIFGLMASMIISQVIGEFINKIFFGMLLSTQGGKIQGFGGFTTILFGTAIYASLMFVIVKETFSLMYKIPDQILRWIGGSTGGLGEFAGNFEQASKSGLAGGVGSALADVGRITGGVSNKLGTFGKALEKPNKSADNNPKDSTPNVSSDSSSSNDYNDNTEQSYSSQMSSQTSKNTSEGQVLDFGHAPYKNREDGKPSYFVKLQTKDGEVTRWGKEIEKNLQSNNVGIGDNISITRLKNEDGKLTSHFSIERKDEEPKS
jgi:conjugal transfer/type IV secretion protein DotA/TraY